MTGMFREAERRSAERVMIRIPIDLQAITAAGTLHKEAAEAVVVSRRGALLQTRSPLSSGAIIEVQNQFSQNTEKFRVVWASGQQVTGHYDVGVELVGARDDFWGVRFPPRT